MGIVGDVLGFFGLGEESRSNREMESAAREDRYQRKQIADQNLKHQQDLLAYQKGVQETTWNREDSAYQRKVADLKKAGINPMMAAGGAGSASGAVVQTSAPQNQMEYRKEDNPKYVGAMLRRQRFLRMLQGANMVEDVLMKQKSVAYTQAQKDLVDAQIRRERYNLGVAQKEGIMTTAGANKNVVLKSMVQNAMQDMQTWKTNAYNKVKNESYKEYKKRKDNPIYKATKPKDESSKGREYWEDELDKLKYQ